MRATVTLFVVLSALLLAITPSLAAKGGGGKPGGGGGGGTSADPAIAFIDHASNGGNALWVMDADGGNAVQLTGSSGSGVSDSAMNPTWTPDGTRIVFEGNVQGNGIYVVDRDGGNLQKLRALNTRAPVPAYAQPAMSPVPTPDGSYRIAFCDLEADYDPSTSQADVYVMNPDGTGLLRLIQTPDAYEADVSWSPDATRLAVRTIGHMGAAPRLIVYDLGVVGGVLTATLSHDLLGVPGSPLGTSILYFANPSWARSQDKVALEASTAVGTRDLWIIDVANPANAVRVPNGAGVWAGGPDWSPADARIVFEDDGRIFSVAPDGTGLVRLAGRSKGDSLSQPAWRRN